MNRNLVSVSLLLRQGLKLVFESNKVVLSKFGVFVGKSYELGGLFRLSVLNHYSSFSYNVVCNNNCNFINDIWHSRLCHVNFESIKRLSDMSLIPEYKHVKGSKCGICVQAKQPRKPFHTIDGRSTTPLELIHSDICEMNGIITKGGKRYFFSLIDDANRFCYIYLLRTKDEALEYFKLYKAEAENQLDKKVKRLRSGRGGEYILNLFNEYCAECGIIHETTAPYAPQLNRVAERKNRTVCDLANALLQSLGMPDIWWGEAVLTVNYVLNRVPPHNHDVTPYEGFKGRKPVLSHLRTWGCLAKVNVLLPKRRKLALRR
jgi:hypothetical protein